MLFGRTAAVVHSRWGPVIERIYAPLTAIVAARRVGIELSAFSSPQVTGIPTALPCPGVKTAASEPIRALVLSIPIAIRPVTRVAPTTSQVRVAHCDKEMLRVACAVRATPLASRMQRAACALADMRDPRPRGSSPSCHRDGIRELACLAVLGDIFQ